MAASETLPARQAALLLHGLQPALRSQVIARLDAAEASRIEPLLQELAELGVPRSLGRQASLPLPAAATDLREPTAQEMAAQLEPDIVERCLQRCAIATVACLLRAADWPWKAQVLDRMPESRRFAVLMCLRDEATSPSPAVLRTLCARLCAQAEQLSANAPAPTRVAALLARIRKHLRRPIEWMR